MFHLWSAGAPGFFSIKLLLIIFYWKLESSLAIINCKWKKNDYKNNQAFLRLMSSDEVQQIELTISEAKLFIYQDGSTQFAALRWL